MRDHCFNAGKKVSKKPGSTLALYMHKGTPTCMHTKHRHVGNKERGKSRYDSGAEAGPHLAKRQLPTCKVVRSAYRAEQWFGKGSGFIFLGCEKQQ